MCTSFQHCAECRSRRRMLIQLYGSCSLVPMATVFALEQKSCIRSLAIKDLCQAWEWGLPVTKSYQQYFKELLMLIFGLNEKFGVAAEIWGGGGGVVLAHCWFTELLFLVIMPLNSQSACMWNKQMSVFCWYELQSRVVGETWLCVLWWLFHKSSFTDA